MDLGSFGQISFTWEFLTGVVTVIFIDLVLAGDNAVVIAMAAQTVPREKRRVTIVCGAGLAVILRVVLAFFAAQLLQISYVKLIGGLVILWIAVKLLIEDPAVKEVCGQAKTIWSAIWIIVVADASMSTDNVLALAGASHGNIFLLIFGLALSIPLVIFGSSLLADLMEKYPFIIYAGAAVLGKVGAELIFTDPVVEAWMQPSKGALYALEAAFAAGVVLVGWVITRRKKMTCAAMESSPGLQAESLGALPEE